jgi:aspartate/methionine/tyrosine aminotransferase
MELMNFLPDVVEQIYKTVSVELCSNVPGQVAVDLMCNPPKPGDPSYPLWEQEYENIYSSLRRKALKLADGLNQLEGVSCGLSVGAMYAFPSIKLTPYSQQLALAAGLPPDTFYCLQLLENTGVCVVPGSGFGQREDTFHFRTTFLPPDQKIDEMIARIRNFHIDFTTRQ